MGLDDGTWYESSFFRSWVWRGDDQSVHGRVAQQLAGLSAFSAIGLRVLIFASVYVILQLFLLRYVKKIEKNPKLSPVYKEDLDTPVAYDLTYETGVDRGLKIFGIGLLLLPLLLVAGFFIPALSSILFPLIALLFVLLSFRSVLISRVMSFKEAGKAFLRGMGGVAPAILLILMAMSIKLIMTRSLVMDYLLYEASMRFEGYPLSAACSTLSHGARDELLHQLRLGQGFSGVTAGAAADGFPRTAPASSRSGLSLRRRFQQPSVPDQRCADDRPGSVRRQLSQMAQMDTAFTNDINSSERRMASSYSPARSRIVLAVRQRTETRIAFAVLRSI